MQCRELLTAHENLWHAATHHRFLEGIHDGSLPREVFERWLAQDYRFVARALRFQALVAAEAPRPDQRVLIDGLAALVAELDWFEAHAAARGLALDVPLHPTCRAYTDFLLAMTHEPYGAAITTVWAIERAYFDAWSSVSSGAPTYREYVEHWTSPEFAGYVAALAEAADRSLAGASSETERAAEDAFIWTSRYEQRFWQVGLEPTT